MTAWRHYNAGTLPPELQPKKIGNIIYVLANPESESPTGRIVGYARVSSAEQELHLENQANRLWAYCQFSWSLGRRSVVVQRFCPVK